VHACRQCGHIFHPLAAADFNPHTPQGMCSACHGLGTTLTVDPDLIVDRPNRSLLDGASRWYGNLRKNKDNKAWIDGSIETVAAHYCVDLTLPWCDLPQHFRDVLLYGSGDEKIHMAHQSERDQGSWSVESNRPFKGACFHINRLFRQTKSEASKRYYMTFMRQQSCPSCGGARIGAAARAVTLGGVTIAAIEHLAIDQLLDWASQRFEQLTAEQLQIGGEALEEIGRRLQVLIDVGLHYLTLDRAAPTLSGGEGQRVRLATQIGSGLVGVLYILDEPSIGLHPRDQRQLIDSLLHLRDMGNTVLVVEHDAATMRAADWLIDIGPGAGTQGGRVIAEGPPTAVASNPASLTGRYLSGALAIEVRQGSPRIPSQYWLTIVGARLHTLKHVTVRFPLNLLTCVTGVSGSGKSSLVNRTLFPALQRALHRADAQPGPHDRIEGLNYLNKVISIDQSPIGRTPRSNPATYVGFYDEIRRLFAETPAAQAQGLGPDRFSFNIEGGRCETCQGHGQLRIEMHFLSDVWITCRDCQGTRFNEATRTINYCNKNIADVLGMDVAEALQFFAHHPKITRALQTLNDVGLDYLKIGQSATTLSGGEAQRIKLASELCRVATGRTLYILDEPTTGLHFADIQRLLDILHRLIDAGNTVIVIEHNLDVIRLADWIIDMGPGGGEAGGMIVAEGSPATIAQNNHSYTGQALRQIETMM
jgi:excinuclease ABC subunit A